MIENTYINQLSSPISSKSSQFIVELLKLYEKFCKNTPISNSNRGEDYLLSLIWTFAYNTLYPDNGHNENLQNGQSSSGELNDSIPYSIEAKQYINSNVKLNHDLLTFLNQYFSPVPSPLQLCQLLEEFNAKLHNAAEYGIYYTAPVIAKYLVTTVLTQIYSTMKTQLLAPLRILDPSCGSGIFILTCSQSLQNNQSANNTEPYLNIFGTDVNSAAIFSTKLIIGLDSLIQHKKINGFILTNFETADFLSQNCSSNFAPNSIDLIIGNPPWGSNISHNSEYHRFKLAKGQYDSYELFVERSLQLLRPNGILAFILPDSLFKLEHEALRKLLCRETTIWRLIKLGEGLFPGVYRCAVIVIVQKSPFPPNWKYYGGIITKNMRKKILSHECTNIDLCLQPLVQADIGQRPHHEIILSQMNSTILKKMEENTVDQKLFQSFRGIELSQNGKILQCSSCFRWNSMPRYRKGTYKTKKCAFCFHDLSLDNGAMDCIIEDKPSKDTVPLINGKDINRYHYVTTKFIKLNITGIKFKDQKCYTGPKILLRKTGIGIYATIDYKTNYFTQAVFGLKLRPSLETSEASNYSLEYFLGILNSRLMLYYYFCRWGELEWKSFPYLTQKMILQLPFKKIDFNLPHEVALHNIITNCVSKALMSSTPVSKDLDWEIEAAVMKLYTITDHERQMVLSALKNQVQRLRIIREMDI